METRRYAVSSNVGYDILGISWSMDKPYLLDGYDVLGKSNLFFFIDQSIIYSVSLMWIRCILQISPEEPLRKSKRVKRSTKKSTKAPTGGVVIRETPEMSLSKKKEKMTVKKRKGIDLLSEVALTKEAEYEEVRKKILRDFHKTHPSGSGTITKIAPSAAKIKRAITNAGTGIKLGVLDVTEEELTKSEAESWGNDEDDSNNDNNSESDGRYEENDSDDKNTQSDSEKGSDFEHETDENESGSESDQEENKEEIGDDEEEEEDEFVKTPSNNFDGEDEIQITDKAEGDEDKEMDYTTGYLYDDVDIRLNKPVQADDETVQKEGTDAEIINVQRGNENPKISHVIEDAHVTLTTIPWKTEVLVTSSSYSSNLAAKFLNFADIPITEAKIVSTIDVHVYHEIPSSQTPTLLIVPISVITESLSDDPLKTQVTALVDEHLDTRLGATKDEFMNYLSALITTRIIEQVVLAKESSQPQSSYEAAASLTEFELKNILIDKIDKSESYLAASKHIKYKDKDEDPSAGSDQGLKKRMTSKDAEPTKDSDMPQDQEDNPGNDDEEPKGKVASKRPAFKLYKGIRTNYAELEYDFEECYKVLSEKLDYENSKGGDYPFDFTKLLPLVKSGNHQKVPVDYFFNNDLKYLQGGVLTITYTTFMTKTKTSQYDLLGIKDMVPNIWSLVKVTYDKHTLWGISHWRKQHKTSMDMHEA
ncbi:hypothetical protein Tco_1327650 [Tanacetum coccineum]